MGVPSEQLMGLMKGAGGAAQLQPPPGGMPDAQTPPMASPMTTPEPQMGSKEGSLINISIAIDLLEQSLPGLGSESEEGAQTLSAIKSLSKVLGGKRQKTGELQQSEILQMIQSLPQAGGATPEMKSLAQAPVPGMPPPGGQPSPAPM